MERRSVLIADDDADIRRGLSARLRASGFDTYFASDGEQAVRIACDTRPGVILLDISMPRCDGLQALERIRSAAALDDVPVIVLSARDPEEYEKRALRRGAVAFFQKPAENEELMAAIERAVRRSASRERTGRSQT